jgi:hypothetical protein
VLCDRNSTGLTSAKLSRCQSELMVPVSSQKSRTFSLADAHEEGISCSRNGLYVNRTSTTHQSWQIDLENFARSGEVFELENVTTPGQRRYVDAVCRKCDLDSARLGTTILFAPKVVSTCNEKTEALRVLIMHRDRILAQIDIRSKCGQDFTDLLNELFQADSRIFLTEKQGCGKNSDQIQPSSIWS